MVSMLGFEKFLRENRTWFKIDSLSNNSITFITRDNGNVGSETPGREDLLEAKRLRKLLKSEFPEWKWEADYVDEWVEVTGTYVGEMRMSSKKRITISSGDSLHVKVAKRVFAKKAGVPVSRTKTAGEIRFIKDQGPEQREIPSDFKFKSKYVKPLSKTMWSLSVAMGHLISAKDRFTKIKSVNISPDGKLGGKGYIQEIREMRKGLGEAIEIITNSIDTISDEIRADHWKEPIETMSQDDQDEVDEIMEEAEDIISDPEGFGDDEVDEMEENLQD